MTRSLPLLFALLACPVLGQATADLAGRWETEYGVLDVVQEADRAWGTYDGGDGFLEGTVRGRRFEYRFRETSDTGHGWVEVAADGRTFSGRWRSDEADEWTEWTGRRPQPAPAGLAGVYRTTYGRMRLRAAGDRIVGSYEADGRSTLEGRLSGDRLTFRYQEENAAGEGSFTFDADRSSFVGRWRAEGDEGWSDWTGHKIDPEPGVLWLVVFEAPWQAGLDGPEYSFGQMLQTFLARHEDVRVRHRRIHDAADFERAVAEVPFLVEPTVLVLASHGDESGLTLSGGVVGAERIARALDEAPNVYLAHFSSCAVMGGRLPDRVLESMTDRRPLSLSGYAVPVDWAASAVLEYLYFDLVVGQRFSPGDAARIVGRELRFAGDRQTEGSPLGAAHFRIQTRE